jgi:hypothetical protein
MTEQGGSTRINARIDRVAEAQLRYVTEHTQMNVTEALRAAIALMYEKVSREHLRPADLLRQGNSFLAMGASGRGDVSERYKDELTELYRDKPGAGLATDADR